MITNARLFVSDCHDPHVNLAREDVLTRTARAGQAVLFLWQNAHTVVVGAGQNAWRECDVELLKRENGTLARRSSGGGAVYHDLGNLNFSFIMPREDYDVSRQLGVVLSAVRSLGIDALATGRNDLTIDNRKFSGNAFRVLKRSALHHGTILVSSDMSLVARYLRVSGDKLKSKGVKSVASRVVNLCELSQAITVESMKRALIDAFRLEYFACPVENIDDMALSGLDEVIARYRDWDFILGASPAGELGDAKRFDWGGIEISFEISSGRLDHVRVFTDAMDETLAPRLETALTGCKYDAAEIRERLLTRLGGREAVDIAAWLCEG